MMWANVTRTMLMPSLCETCHHLRIVVAAKGSRFLLCQRSQTNSRYPKYPPQPVIACGGYQPADSPSVNQELPFAVGPGAFDQSSPEPLR